MTGVYYGGISDKLGFGLCVAVVLLSVCALGFINQVAKLRRDIVFVADDKGFATIPGALC